jgi:predicted DCC family thiol-disulfide oxidoreductase YuxK
MQINVAMVYAFTSTAKLMGSEWRDGTAVYYPLHNPDYVRLPMFWMDASHVWLVHLVTWATLAVEIAMWTLVWIPRLRLKVLGCAIFLHLMIDYSINIPLFEWLMIASFLLFLTSADLEKAREALSRSFAAMRMRLVYDGECGFCRSALLLVRYFDIMRLITPLDYHRPEELAEAGGVGYEEADAAAIAVDCAGRRFMGFYAFRQVARRLPVCWIGLPLLYLPGVPALGERAYRWIAANRSRLPVAPRCRTRRPKERAAQVV